jgi:PTH1 family peptidyl-tRNA hydrolase
MWLICGLGNPGPKYAGTRHNIGFMVVDRLAERWRAPTWQQKFKGEATTTQVAGEPALLLKPLTYMNVSGDSVQPAMAFYKLGLDRLIVIHDELDLPLGKLKLKKGGGHGGHNGIRHIAGRLGEDFFRVRAGIGRPDGKKSVSSHVLGGFAGDEAIEADLLVDKTADAVETVIKEGLLAAQNKFHEKPQKKKGKQNKPKEGDAADKASDTQGQSDKGGEGDG